MYCRSKSLLTENVSNKSRFLAAQHVKWVSVKSVSSARKKEKFQFKFNEMGDFITRLKLHPIRDWRGEHFHWLHHIDSHRVLILGRRKSNSIEMNHCVQQVFFFVSVWLTQYRLALQNGWNHIMSHSTMFQRTTEPVSASTQRTMKCFRLCEYFSTFNWLYVTETAKAFPLLFFVVLFVRIIGWERIKRSTLFILAHPFSCPLSHLRCAFFVFAVPISAENLR